MSRTRPLALGSSGHRERQIFWGLVVLHLIPLWAFRHLPTQDGPGHLAVASLLAHLDLPAGEPLRAFFERNVGNYPNYFIFGLLAEPLRFLSPRLTERLLLSGYVVLLPWAARYALGAVRPRSRFLAVLALPFLFSFPFQMGFYNFCFGLAGFFLTLGYWLRHRGRFDPLITLGLALLACGTYFCHGVALVMTAASVLLLAAWQVWLDLRRSRLPARAPGPGQVGALTVLPHPELVEAAAPVLRRRLGPPLVAWLPALLLMALYVADHLQGPSTRLSAWVLAKQLAALYSLVALDFEAVWLSAALAGLFGLLAGWQLVRRLRRRGPLTFRDGLLLVPLLCTAAYFAAPNQTVGGALVNQRLNLLPFLALLFWLAAFAWPAGARRWIQAAAATVSLALLALTCLGYARLQPYLEEYRSAAGRVAPGRTLLAVAFAPQGEAPDGRPLSFRTRPFLHADSGSAAERLFISLTLNQANEDYFPVMYRPEVNPFRQGAILGPLEVEPPVVDPLGYTVRTGRTVDYVLLWQGDRRQGPAADRLFAQLAAAYEPVFESAQGNARLFRLRLDRLPHEGRQSRGHGAVTGRVPVLVPGVAQALPVGVGEQAVERRDRDAAPSQRLLQGPAVGLVVRPAAFDQYHPDLGSLSAGGSLQGGESAGGWLDTGRAARSGAAARGRAVREEVPESRQGQAGQRRVPLGPGRCRPDQRPAHLTQLQVAVDEEEPAGVALGDQEALFVDERLGAAVAVPER